MKEEILNTKFGKARIYNGYYKITSTKEGNHNKHLHRLIWEDHYGKPVPEGYDIHHINLDKRDNRIQNLQCVERSLHHRFHSKGRKHSKESKRKISENKKGRKRKPFSDEWKYKMSEAHNTSGYFRVTKVKDKTCKQGFIWRYIYIVKIKNENRLKELILMTSKKKSNQEVNHGIN